MATSNFGIARPLPFSKLAKGMLVLAAPHDGQRYFGVATMIRDDWMLAVLSSTEGDVPAVIDLGYVIDDLWRVPGSLEIEPRGTAFQPSMKRSSGPAFAIDSDGNVGALIDRVDMGLKRQFLINLSDGEHLDRADKIAFFKEAKFFIRQEGRSERFEWPSLTPEQ